MSGEANKTFYKDTPGSGVSFSAVLPVAVRIAKDGEGDLKDDLNFEQIIKKIKNNISEAVGITMGVINSYQLGDVEEVDNG